MLLFAFGSNLPTEVAQPVDIIEQSIVNLNLRIGGKLTTSCFYRTPAFPKGNGPDFVNAAGRVDAPISAQDALAICHEIEAEMGRTRQVRWEARVVDIDLIAAGDEVAPSRLEVQGWIDKPLDAQLSQAPDRMILPHPRMHERSFVLRPLLDVAPNWRHPILGLTVAEMLAMRPKEEQAEVVAL